MATIVERPSSAIHDMNPQPVIPQRRPREESIEIIDVDELDDSIYEPGPSTSNSVSGRSSPRRAQRRRLSPEAIVVISDSDDDDFEPEIIATSSWSTSSSSRAPSRYISPPPRPSGSQNVPPVPHVPDEFAGFTSLPMRQRPPPFPDQNASSRNVPAPPIFADPAVETFDFGRFSSRNNSPQPSSSSHSGPSGNLNRHRHQTGRESNAGTTGASSGSSLSQGGRLATVRLGGGLITSTQSNLAQERAEREQRAQQRASGPAPRFRHRTRPARASLHYIGQRQAEIIPFERIWLSILERDYGRPFDLGDDDTLYHNGVMRFAAGGRQMGMTQQEPDYKPSYTHPDPPEPGFTFDFAPPEPPAETKVLSSSLSPRRPEFPATSAENPIVLDDDGEIVEVESSSVTPAATTTTTEEKFPSTLKMLLVCSRCRDPLLLGEGASASALKMAAAGASAEEVEAERRGRRLWGLRCGHLVDGKCLDVFSVPAGALEGMEKRDVKGKGKGRAVEVSSSMGEGEDDSGLKETPVLAPVEEYRSKLRSSKSGGGARRQGQGQGQAGESSKSGSSSSSSTSSKPKPKPRGRTRKNHTEEVYRWECPVPGCAMVHTSAKVNGVWGPEKEKGEGAIALFV